MAQSSNVELVETSHSPSVDTAAKDCAAGVRVNGAEGGLREAIFSEGTSASTSPTEVALSPVDTGYAAWTFLGAAALLDAVIWSVPWSYGILLDTYLQDPATTTQPHATTLLPLVGTCSSGLMFCSGAIIYPYMCQYPRHRRPLRWAGILLCCASLFASSYVRKVWELVMLQGVLYAIGGALAYHPCISYMSEWFVRRRGLANGVLFAGTSAGGLALPFILPALLKAYGIFVTLRIISVASLLLLLACHPFIKPRLPESRIPGPAPRTSISPILGDRTFWAILVANTLQGFAFFIPLVWLPTFASTLQLRTALSSAALALLNGSSALGPMLVGLLSDRLSPWPIALIGSALSCLCTFVFWGAMRNTVGLMLFGATYGLVAGSWSTLWGQFAHRISKGDPSLSMSLYGLFMMTRGLGNILCTPISTALLSTSISSTTAYRSNGEQGATLHQVKWQKLIVYVGTCFAGVSIISLMGWARDRTSARRDLV